MKNSPWFRWGAGLALALGLILTGCESPTASKDPAKGTVTGTITVPSQSVERTVAVFIDTDTNGGNGTTASTTLKVPANTTSVKYSFSDVLPGTYYVSAVEYIKGTSGAPITGDYAGYSGFPGMPGTSDKPNVTVAAGKTATADITLSSFTDAGNNSGSGSGSGTGNGTTDPTKGTVTGTITLPASVNGITYAVMVDPDTDGGNKNQYYTNATVTGNKITYSVQGVAPGSYYVYAIVWASGSGGGAPGAGDYFGAYGIKAQNEWPTQTPKVTVTAGGTNTCDFALYGGSGSGSGSSSGTSDPAKGTVSGTITVPANMAGRYWAVWVFSKPGDGSSVVGSAKGSVGTSTTIPYSVPNVAPGTYYVDVVYYQTSDISKLDGAYYSYNQYNAMQTLPLPGPNVAVTAGKETSGVDISGATAYPTGSGTAPATGTVSGSLTVPSQASDKQLTVFVLKTPGQGDSTTPSSTLTVPANTTSVKYTVTGVPAGTYYVVAVEYLAGTAGSQPVTGDWAAYASADGSAPASPNITVSAGQTATADVKLAAFTSSGSGTGSGSGSGSTTAAQALPAEADGFWILDGSAVAGGPNYFKISGSNATSGNLNNNPLTFDSTGQISYYDGVGRAKLTGYFWRSGAICYVVFNNDGSESKSVVFKHDNSRLSTFTLTSLPTAADGKWATADSPNTVVYDIKNSGYDFGFIKVPMCYDEKGVVWMSAMTNFVPQPGVTWNGTTFLANGIPMVKTGP